MRHRDSSFATCFVFVVLLHVAGLGWLLMGPRGCQQSLADAPQPLLPEPRNESVSQPIQLNLTLQDRVNASAAAPARETASVTDPSIDPSDPASRLVLPKPERPVITAEPEAQPPPEPPRPDPEIAKREEAERQELLAQQRKIEDQARKLKEAERKLAAQETERQERERKDREAAEKERKRELARKADSESEAKRIAKAKAQAREKELAANRERKRKADEEAARKRKAEEARKQKLVQEREAERKRLADAAEAKVARLAQEKAEAERKRELAQRVEVDRQAEADRKRKAEQAAARQRLIEQEEKRRQEEAKRIEPAKVVGEPPASPDIVPANVLGSGGPAVVPPVVKPKLTRRGGGGEAPSEADMASYRASVQQRILTRWSTPKGLSIPRRPAVVVRIDRSGKIVYSRLDTTSGNDALDQSAIDAVRIGSRLIPLPPGFPKRTYEVTVKFQID